MGRQKKAAKSPDPSENLGRSSSGPEKAARKVSAGDRGDAVPFRQAKTKTDLIRETAQELAAQMSFVRPRDVVEALKQKEIDVSSPQVSMALRDTPGLVVRQKRRYLGRGLHSPPLRFAGASVSFDDLLKARDYVELIGSVEKAIAALLTYRNFDDQKASQPQPEPTAGSQLDAAV